MPFLATVAIITTGTIFIIAALNKLYTEMKAEAARTNAELKEAKRRKKEREEARPKEKYEHLTNKVFNTRNGSFYVKQTISRWSNVYRHNETGRKVKKVYEELKLLVDLFVNVVNDNATDPNSPRIEKTRTLLDITIQHSKRLADFESMIQISGPNKKKISKRVVQLQDKIQEEIVDNMRVINDSIDNILSNDIITDGSNEDEKAVAADKQVDDSLDLAKIIDDRVRNELETDYYKKVMQ